MKPGPLRERLLGVALAAAVGGALFLAWAYWRAPEATVVQPGDLAPDLELPTLGGAPARLSGFRGQPVLLVMFLSGCKHCEADADEIEKLHRTYFQRGLVVLGVSVDPDEARLRDFVSRHGTSYFVMEDYGGRTVREVWGSWKMPEAYLIDAAGRVDAVWVGGVDWLGPDVRQRIERLLARSSSSRSSTSPTR